MLFRVWHLALPNSFGSLAWSRSANKHSSHNIASRPQCANKPAGRIVTTAGHLTSSPDRSIWRQMRAAFKLCRPNFAPCMRRSGFRNQRSVREGDFRCRVALTAVRLGEAGPPCNRRIFTTILGLHRGISWNFASFSRRGRDGPLRVVALAVEIPISIYGKRISGPRSRFCAMRGVFTLWITNFATWCRISAFHKPRVLPDSDFRYRVALLIYYEGMFAILNRLSGSECRISQL
jgi:hypothetical protein